jgi:two-component system cell cycle sensor histidine kinase/response regulator CckA
MNTEYFRNNQEELMKALFREALNPIFVVDEEGHYIDANPAALEFVELSKEELLTKVVWDFAPPERLPIQKQQHSPFTSQRTLETDYLINGKIKTLLLNIVPIKMNDKTILYGIGQDITERKKILQDLRLTQFSVDRMGNEVFWARPDGSFEYVNDKACSSLGYSREELLQMKVFDIDPNVTKENWERHWRELKKEEVLKFESAHIAKSGVRYPTEVTTNYINYNGKEYNCAFVRDISERKQAEQVLKSSEAKLKSAFKAAPIGMGFVKNRIVGWTNDQMSSILGYMQDEMWGMDARMLYENEEEYERVGREKHVEIRKKGLGALETRMKRKDGKIIDVYLSSASIDPNDPLGILIFTVMDITDRKKAEEALRESRSMFQALAENSPDIIIRLDRELRFLYINSAIWRYSGKEPRKYLGRTADEMVLDKEYLRDLKEKVSLAFRTGFAYEGQHVFQGLSGNAIFDWRLIPEISSEGKVETVLVISRDITEMKRLQEFASQAMRLETAGRIAGQVAHDFNNLLGPLMAYPEIIMEEFPENHPMLPLLDDMKNAAEQIADINQQLLTLGRRAHYNQEILNLNEIVRQTINRIFPRPNTLIIEKDLAGNLMNIKGGASQILRAVTNLILNARDAMQDIGRMTIKTENAYVDERNGRFGQILRGEYVRLTISDTGCGIPEDILTRIFDPFFTTKSPNHKRGSGLGLSVVHAVMEDHQGYIDIESVIGEGTSVYLYFPITREKRENQYYNTVRGGSEKILVVDDDRVQLEVMQRLLEKLGYKVTTVESGEMALEVTNNVKFDLVVLDMVMPGGMDGAETYRRLLEKYPEQKAIIVSGYAESERVADALEMGAGIFLKKPLTLNTISMEVRGELDRDKVKQ